MKTAVRTLAEIDADIAAVQRELLSVKGTETEVYARIVGYYRSVRNWNKGKRDEYGSRTYFVYENTDSCRESTYQDAQGNAACPVPVPSGYYELYTRKTCPNCPPVKEYLMQSDMAGTAFDVDSDSGFKQAAERSIFSVPTVIFYDAEGRETGRAHSVSEMLGMMGQKTVSPAV